MYNVFVSDLGSRSKEWKRLKIPFEQMICRFETVGSCNGLLRVSHYELDDPVFIYNSFSTCYNQLPLKGTERLSGKTLRAVSGFGFHPETNVYKVVKIVYCEGSPSETPDPTGIPDVYVVTLGTNPRRYMGQLDYQLIGVQSEVR